MPIKTMNNNGLQVLEEVPGEYAIYIDKDAVMTTVAKYAPGSYQTFMDRKTDVDNSRSLLKGYKIEWTQRDDSDLFIQCNNEAISKIENQPMTLDEPTQPIVLEPKTVPTTYECCFRVDKKTGEFYIGEGYENYQLTDIVSTTISIDENGYYLITNNTNGNNWARYEQDGSYLVSLVAIDSSNVSVFKYGTLGPMYDVLIGVEKNGTLFRYSDTNNYYYGIYTKGATIGDWVKIKANMTKTSTHKPFVKSVMPTGKLDRITNANETTHTFLNKGDGVVTFGNGYFSLKGEKIQQLLVYKGILTEEQKQIELNKTFKVR